jgi:transposase
MPAYQITSLSRLQIYVTVLPNRSKSSRKRIEVNLEELDRIIDRGTDAPLSRADSQKLKTALHAMADRLTGKRSTDKTAGVLPKPAVPPPAKEQATDESSPAGHGHNGAAAFTGADRVSVPHATVHSGDACPECNEGKVYRQKEPATLVRIVGQAPLKTTVFEMERLRCNACGEIFTAEPPETAGPDKYDATAVAMIAMLKYETGLPFKRLERVESQLATPLPAATQSELLEAAAEFLRPVLDELIRQAAQGGVMHNDDTSMRMLRYTRDAGDTRARAFSPAASCRLLVHIKSHCSSPVFMNLIHTCELNGVNPLDYLAELLRHSEESKQKASEWMPWNYRDRLPCTVAA